MNNHGIGNGRTVRVLLTILLLLGLCSQANAQYSLAWGTVRTAGGTSTGGNYTLHHGIGADGVPMQVGNPDAPTPNPMGWSIAPYATDSSTITMTALEASDPNGGVQYYFEEIDNPSINSGWLPIGTRTWEATGLTENTVYRFHVKAKNALGNITEWSLSLPTITLPSTGSIPKGSVDPVSGEMGNDLTLSVDTFTGSANYSIPIELPPGRQGSEPRIALTYNSDGKNGWCGMGWSLGMGGIARDTNKGVPVAQETNGQFIKQYDDDKGFVLLGSGNSRLVLIEEYPSGEREYRAQVDKNFNKYIYNASSNTWTVYDKGGTEYLFGQLQAESQTAGALMVHPQFDSTTPGDNTFAWHLGRIQDARGNLTYIYYTSDANQIYLDEVRYNGHTEGLLTSSSVKFVLVDADVNGIPDDRADKSFSYATGYRIETNKLLGDVKVEVNGNKVRRYHLNYKQSESTLRSLLSSVVMYGVDDVNSLPPVTFDYTTKPFSFDDISDWGRLGYGDNIIYKRILDDNPGTDYLRTSHALVDNSGDGIPDLLRTPYVVDHYSDVECCYGSYDPNEAFRYENKYDLGSFGLDASTVVSDTTGVRSETKITYCDLNGDLLLDRVECEDSPDDMGNPSVLDMYSVSFFQHNSFGDEFSPYQDWGTVLHTGYGTYYLNKSVYYDQANPGKTGYGLGYGSGGYGYQFTQTPPAEPNESRIHILMVDMNNDGLVDRIMSGHSDHQGFLVQLNTGNGFSSALVPWSNNHAGTVPPELHYEQNGITYQFSGLLDINGDGLPDRVLRESSPPGNEAGNPNLYDYLLVQFNTGYTFECNAQGDAILRPWGSLYNQGQTDIHWGGLSYTTTQVVDQNEYSAASLSMVDINGDGLLDRVMRKLNAPYDRFVVELNTGNGFVHLIDNQPIEWTNVNSEEQVDDLWFWRSVSGSITYPDTTLEQFISMIDINGDGLLDRVMHTDSLNPYYHFKVQLNSGTVPDMLCKVTGKLGGSVEVDYTPASHHNTKYDYQPIHRPTVTKLMVNDGLGNFGETTYEYARGWYEYQTREFRGYGKVTSIDPAGLKTITYFHQGGGYDGGSQGMYSNIASIEGEYLDAGAVAKAGVPYRIDKLKTHTDPSQDNNPYSITVNKVEETEIKPGSGWYHAYISQETHVVFDGSTPLPTFHSSDIFDQYCASVHKFTYDVDWNHTPTIDPTGNVLSEIDYGAVRLGNDEYKLFMTYLLNWYQYYNIDPNADVYIHTSYADLPNEHIVNRVSGIKATSDPGGNDVLKETAYNYDSQGNLVEIRRWLDKNTDGPVNGWYLASEYDYDIYGNLDWIRDSAGIETTIIYETNQFIYPWQKVVGDPNYPMSFTTMTQFDPNSGLPSRSVDAAGMVTEKYYDNFFRLTDITASREPNGIADLWLTHIGYHLDPCALDGTHTDNYIYQVHNGYEAWLYNDGLGRVVQKRVLTEQGAQGTYRISAVSYNENGLPTLKSTHFFSDDPNYITNAIWEPNVPSTLTTYDQTGRVAGVYQVLDDTYIEEESSPGIGTLTSYDVTFGEQRQTVMSVPSSKYIYRLVKDCHGQIVDTFEFCRDNGDGSYYFSHLVATSTNYEYDRLGRETKITDCNGVEFVTEYDSFGRKIRSIDPDMGMWRYAFDASNRLIEQLDSRNNKVILDYNDVLGRLSEKRVYDSFGQLQETIAYTYDQSNEPNDYWVHKGQIYKIEDGQGWAKLGYDKRGQLIKRTRKLNINDNEYTIQSAYDHAGRLGQLNYPGNKAVLSYAYDDAGHQTKVESLWGTGESEVFCQLSSFDDLGRPTELLYGNGTRTAHEYYPHTKRLERIYTLDYQSQALQDLQYTYDAVAEVNNIFDQVNASGAASCSMTGIEYDTAGRITSFYSGSKGATVSFNYFKNGNLKYSAEHENNGYQYQYLGSGHAHVQPHAVTWVGSASYSYDACGNMTSRNTAEWGQQTLSYDFRNRLEQVVADSNSITFGYAHDNSRLWKKFNDAIVQIWLGGIYEEKDGRILCHVHANGKLIATFEPEGNIPLVNPVFCYYHKDHLGSSQIITNREGEDVQRYGYNAFGGQGYSSNSEDFTVSRRYTSQILDEETGLYYYNARYYDPQLGRFIQADTIIPEKYKSQTLNRYTYCINNPVRYTDPTGHDWDDFVDDWVVNPITKPTRKITEQAWRNTKNITGQWYRDSWNISEQWLRDTKNMADQTKRDLKNLKEDYYDLIKYRRASDKSGPSVKESYGPVNNAAIASMKTYWQNPGMEEWGSTIWQHRRTGFIHIVEAIKGEWFWTPTDRLMAQAEEEIDINFYDILGITHRHTRPDSHSLSSTDIALANRGFYGENIWMIHKDTGVMYWYNSLEHEGSSGVELGRLAP